ncbi:MAG: class I SAM-dependent methyltransferase [Bryobacterales bacterium]|nr:class I SAM-dependent methyltransferase [Bryobacterales bacterium]
MLRRSLIAAAAVSAGSISLPAPLAAQRGRRGTSAAPTLSQPKDDTEKRIQGVIHDMAIRGGTWASVPTDDGQWLRILTESVNAQRVVEVGTSTGYSGLFFSLALTRTGGKLITHDIDEGRSAQAKANFERAGVSAMVTQVLGDAQVTLKKIEAPVDVVFLDADKEGYVPYLDILLPHVRPGGLILAHNTDMVPLYLERVQRMATLETVIYTGGGGLSVSLKKR